ncbi:hypothetical protein AB0M36_28730 [Actinoplanes sp. NPDC051346]
MVPISQWNVDDKPQSRFEVARELVTVWVVHIHRSYQVIRGTR